MPMTADEFWQVLRRAYETEYFGPIAYANSNFARITADKENLLHRYNGGPSGVPNAEEQDVLRPQIVAAIESLFAGQLDVVVHPGYIDFSLQTGIGFAVRP
jgi:hypothetical protein